MSGRAGDVLLVESKDNLAELKGQTLWRDQLEPMGGGTVVVRATSLDNPKRWVQLLGDDANNFKAMLPPGRYVLSYPYPVWGGNIGPS